MLGERAGDDLRVAMDGRWEVGSSGHAVRVAVRRGDMVVLVLLQLARFGFECRR